MAKFCHITFCQGKENGLSLCYPDKHFYCSNMKKIAKMKTFWMVTRYVGFRECCLFIANFFSWVTKPIWLISNTFFLELVSKELNHFGEIAGLFRQIGGHRSRFVLFCSFWRLFTIKMIKSVKVFPFSFWKIMTFFIT